MTTKVKRIIAKEFLAIIVLFTFTAMFWGGIYLRNNYYDITTRNLEYKISNRRFLYDSLRKGVISKIKAQEELVVYIFSNYRQEKLEKDVLEELTPLFWQSCTRMIRKDSLGYWWEKTAKKAFIYEIQNFGLQTPEEFQEYITLNTITKNDSLRLRLSLQEAQEIQQLQLKLFPIPQKFVNEKERKSLTVQFIVILGILIFPFRYLIYGIIWSITVLKTKE